MSVPGVPHVQVLALDALVAPALLRRVLAVGRRLTRDVALGVVATVALLAGYWVTSVAMTVAFASGTIKNLIDCMAFVRVLNCES